MVHMTQLVNLVLKGFVEPYPISDDASAKRVELLKISQVAAFLRSRPSNALDTASVAKIPSQDAVTSLFNVYVDFEGLTEEVILAEELSLFSVKDSHDYLKVLRIRLPEDFDRNVPQLLVR